LADPRAFGETFLVRLGLVRSSSRIDHRGSNHPNLDRAQLALPNIGRADKEDEDIEGMNDLSAQWPSKLLRAPYPNASVEAPRKAPRSTMSPHPV
jgi:hypothetical protein